MQESASGVRQFAKGDVLVQEGDPASRKLYILLQGSIGLYKHYGLNNEMQEHVLSQGSFSGEMSLFLDQEPVHTLVALTDVLVLVIEKKEVADFFATQTDMALRIVQQICKQLDEAQTALQTYRIREDQPQVSQKSSLFPEGHGEYLLQMANSNEDLLHQEKSKCPLCGYSFDSLMVLTSRLRILRTDPDLRVRYRDIEPLHYDIITCPNCHLSASFEQFPEISSRWVDAVNRKIGPFKLELHIATGRERDTFTVFAGYYLAILCAEICFDDYQLIRAGLWQKLSRLYQDCEDAAMQLYAADHALADYLYAYEHFYISEKQSQHLCYVIGDLYARRDDLDEARKYFFYAKSNRAGTVVMARQADQRLEQIREIRNRRRQSEE